MGLVIHITCVCDKCTVNQVELANTDTPLPDQWMRAQGYANISAGTSAAINGYFCPTCIQTYGTRDLVKVAADLCSDLTDAPPS